MMIQYAKFMKVATETSWRQPVASLNYIESSTLWRQEHNGFSHQNPGFINAVINLKSSMVRVYLPPDANTLVSTMDHCVGSKKYLNLIVASKQPMPVWLSMEDAIEHCRLGASIWRWASTFDGENPDVIIAGCGCELTFEAVAASALLKRDAPSLKLRVVNVTDLMILKETGGHPHALNEEKFASLFGTERPVIFNFHGYPDVIYGLIFERLSVRSNWSVHGYNEEGTTTTPFKMLVSNACSRYDLAIDALTRLKTSDAKFDFNIDALVERYKGKMEEHDRFIMENGKDPEWVEGIGEENAGAGAKVLFE